jgi:hypothetical protein
MLILDIKDISGWFQFHSLIMNLYRKSLILSLEDTWNTSKLKSKNLHHLSFKVLWNYIHLLHLLSVRQLLISITSSTLDIFQMCLMDYLLLNPLNSKTQRKWSELGFMNLKEPIVIDWLQWTILTPTRL